MLQDPESPVWNPETLLIMQYASKKTLQVIQQHFSVIQEKFSPALLLSPHSPRLGVLPLFLQPGWVHTAGKETGKQGQKYHWSNFTAPIFLGTPFYTQISALSTVYAQPAPAGHHLLLPLAFPPVPSLRPCQVAAGLWAGHEPHPCLIPAPLLMDWPAMESMALPTSWPLLAPGLLLWTSPPHSGCDILMEQWKQKGCSFAHFLATVICEHTWFYRFQ